MLRFVLPAVMGLLLTVANACAAEPKTSSVSLEDLKYAVTKAEQRGENVGAVAAAVTALEKALAKFTAKEPNEAPPELTALREVVEAVAKKGENVEAISKELGRIEKALTGREYERPKPPEPQPEPEPKPEPGQPFRPGRGGFNRGGVVIGGAGKGRVIVNGGGNFNSTSITISNGEYTIKARQGDTTYFVSGDLNGAGKEKFAVQEGEKKNEYEDIKKVPEKHRAALEELVKMVSK